MVPRHPPGGPENADDDSPDPRQPLQNEHPFMPPFQSPFFHQSLGVVTQHLQSMQQQHGLLPMRTAPGMSLPQQMIPHQGIQYLGTLSPESGNPLAPGPFWTPYEMIPLSHLGPPPQLPITPTLDNASVLPETEYIEESESSKASSSKDSELEDYESQPTSSPDVSPAQPVSQGSSSSTVPTSRTRPTRAAVRSNFTPQIPPTTSPRISEQTNLPRHFSPGGTVTFHCPDKTCPYKTKRKQNMRQHIKHKSKERPYICPVCERGFGRPKDLERHGSVHVTTNEFKCEFCQKAYKRKDGLLRHMKVHEK
ncbi:hypothetical protein HDU98_003851 [Podochytrium sp. JEL0797]|nr:hypothetical protein HDU98_003851 [Podochytrium sp. JEL0797]